LVVDLIIDLIAFEASAEGGGDCTWDAVAFVAVVENVEEGEAGVFGNCGGGGGVDQVPG